MPYYNTNGVAILSKPPLWVLEPIETQTEVPIVLCHYPMAHWDRRHYGSWHLFGHCHGRFEVMGLAYDVGVDNNDFYPVSLDQVVEIMKGRKEY
jgi:calcineurin-like phosphoesterase family protein